MIGEGAEKRLPLNVLFITTDDLGLQLSCYGDKVIKTPHLDALAASGARFEVAYVAQASCSPSRSAMFTGLYPHANGQYGLTNAGKGFALHEEYREQTLPALLKKQGYRTGIIGKLHVAPEKCFPFDYKGVPGARTRFVKEVAQSASKFFRQKGKEPFFLMVNYSDPHASRLDKKSGDWFFERQVEGLPDNPLEPGEAPPWPFQGIEEPETLENIANYYNCVMRVDIGVGMLLDELKKSGRHNDTLVIFIGDHGPPFARGKTTCYEAGLRVPFLVRWPGVSKKGTVSSALVSTVDILPTVLDAVGAPLPEGLHGESLRPVLAKNDAPWRDYLVGEFQFHGGEPFYPRRAIRDGRFKLIHNLRAGEARPSTGVDGDKAYAASLTEPYNGTDVRAAFETFANPPEFELYDLEADPIEFHNLAGLPELREEEARLKSELAAWQRETDDPLREAEGLTSWVSQYVKE